MRGRRSPQTEAPALQRDPGRNPNTLVVRYGSAPLACVGGADTGGEPQEVGALGPPWS